MLYTLCVFAMLAAQALSTSNYFIGLFYGTYYWPYPIDMCVLNGVGSLFNYVKYTCEEDGSVTRSVYPVTDTTCSTTPSTTSYSEEDETTDGLYAFNCAGTNDYIETKLLIGSCASALTFNVYSAANACFKIHENSTFVDGYEQIQCTSDAATISVYGSAIGSCVPSLYTSLASQQTISTTCALYIPAASGVPAVYAKLTDCVYDDITNFPVTMDNSDDFPDPPAPYMGISVTIDAMAASSLGVNPDVCEIMWYNSFLLAFDNCMVSVTTTCDSNEGSGYPSVNVEATITVYDADDFMTCEQIETLFQASISGNPNTAATIDCSTYEITTTTTTTSTTSTTPSPTKSSGSMMGINYLIVLAISYFVMML